MTVNIGSTGNWATTGTWDQAHVPATTEEIHIPRGSTVSVDTAITTSANEILIGTGTSGSANVWVPNFDGSGQSKAVKIVGTTGVAYSGPVGGSSHSTSICWDGAAMWTSSNKTGALTKLVSGGNEDKTQPVFNNDNKNSATLVCAQGYIAAVLKKFIWSIGVRASNSTLSLARINISDAPIDANSTTYYTMVAQGQRTDAMASDGTNIWVGNYAPNTGTPGISILNIASPATLTNTHVGWPACTFGLLSMAWDGTDMWGSLLATNGSVLIKMCGSTRDTTTKGDVIGTYTCGAPDIAGLCWDGTYMWVANATASMSVSKFSKAGALIQTYPIGRHVSRLAVIGTKVYMVTGNDRTVFMLDSVSGAVTSVFTFSEPCPWGPMISAIAADGGSNIASLAINAGGSVTIDATSTAHILAPSGITVNGAAAKLDVYGTLITDTGATLTSSNGGAYVFHEGSTFMQLHTASEISTTARQLDDGVVGPTMTPEVNSILIFVRANGELSDTVASATSPLGITVTPYINGTLCTTALAGTVQYTDVGKYAIVADYSTAVTNGTLVSGDILGLYVEATTAAGMSTKWYRIPYLPQLDPSTQGPQYFAF